MKTLLLVLLVAFTGHSAHAQDSPSDPVFAVDALAYGTEADREAMDLDTPRSALEAFVTAARRGQYERAALILDVRDLPEPQRTERAVQLAERLHAVLERRVWIDWDALPDRPDGMMDNASSQHALLGDKRRSLRLSTLKMDDIPISIRLNRISVDGGPPVWVFSHQTVDHIDAMFAAYGPTALERSIPQGLRREALLGLEIWELLAVPCCSCSRRPPAC